MTPAPSTSTAGQSLSSEEQLTIEEARPSTRRYAHLPGAKDGRGASDGRWPRQARCSRPQYQVSAVPRTATSSSRRCSMASTGPIAGTTYPQVINSDGNAKAPGRGCENVGFLHAERLSANAARSFAVTVRRRARSGGVEEPDDAVDGGESRAHCRCSCGRRVRRNDDCKSPLGERGAEK